MCSLVPPLLVAGGGRGSMKIAKESAKQCSLKENARDIYDRVRLKYSWQYFLYANILSFYHFRSEDKENMIFVYYGNVLSIHMSGREYAGIPYVYISNVLR